MAPCKILLFACLEGKALNRPATKSSRPRKGAPPRPHADRHSDACAHAAERASQAPLALSEAERICRDRGARLTAIRRQVLESLYDTHRPLGAYDLAESLTARVGRRIAPITIYRALEFLLEQGLIHRLVTRNAFVACPHQHGRHDVVAFLICEKCGGVDEASPPSVSIALDGVLKKGQFAPREQIVEIAGLCAHCQAKGPPGRTKTLTQPAARSS
jgi:Fur family transcriptional regulator, zinc uptake regulator